MKKICFITEPHRRIIGSVVLRTSQHADRVRVIEDDSMDRTAMVAREEPQIHSPPEELGACYARGRAGNADERRYDYNTFINLV